MIIKIVTLFLIGIAALAMFGRLRLPGKGKGRSHGLPRPRLCPDCGRYNLTGGPCRRCTKGS
jgi:hypothetical protein